MVVKNERFEPHPVSGEVEIDWEGEVEVAYKRIDEETLQSLISLADLGLCVKLVWCMNDEMGGGDGWRIGEVAVLDAADRSWGQPSIRQAEETFLSQRSQLLSTYGQPDGTNTLLTPEAEAETGAEDDDDEYWAQYDNTPARTPAPNQSTAPPNTRLPADARMSGNGGGLEDEAAYYAQYASVQPAMDNHDPDEAQQNGEVESSLGYDQITKGLSQRSHPPIGNDHESHSSSMAWSEDLAGTRNGAGTKDVEGDEKIKISNYEPHFGSGLAQPRPASSTGSSGSDTVAKLEKRVATRERAREQSEVGIKQHIGSSVKSLYRLARVAGIEREEFERIVRTELDCLGLMDEDD